MVTEQPATEAPVIAPLQSVPLFRSQRYQEVGNDVTMKRAIYKFSAFAYPISQLDHACSRLGLGSPDEFGWPLRISKIVTVGAPVQTRPQTALLIAYEFGEFQPSVFEVSLTARRYLPSEVDRVHDILSGYGPIAGVFKEPLLPIAGGCHGSVDEALALRAMRWHWSTRYSGRAAARSVKDGGSAPICCSTPSRSTCSQARTTWPSRSW